MSNRRDKSVPATEFKAKCLALIDGVAATRRPLVVTKRGRAVARVVPLSGEGDDLRGSVLSQVDLIAPIGDAWDAEA